jgi:glycerophosphoryl diester phosphodiesterase
MGEHLDVVMEASMDSRTQHLYPQDFLVIAHRGASSYAPENTIAAFDLALQMGARHLELDVHLTRDDYLVVIHDDTVDRTTNGTGPVASQTFAALQGLDAGTWFGEAFVGVRIPTLAEVLTRYQGRMHLHIELKGLTTHLPQRTVDTVHFPIHSSPLWQVMTVCPHRRVLQPSITFIAGITASRAGRYCGL